MKIKWLVIPSLLALTAIGTVAALPVLLPVWEEHRPRAKVVIDGALRAQAIDALVANINQHYVFPDKAKQIETLLRARQMQGKYDAISDGAQLADQLTADVATIAHDLHMKVQVSADMLPPQPKADARSRSAAQAGRVQDANFIMRAIDSVGKKMATFGVVKADHITPNIAYLKMSHFAPPHLAGEKYAAAMDKLADADAMIIDMRGNGGGDPRSVALLISYFVDQRTRLNDIWSRDTGETTQYWTADSLAGTRFGGVKPVAILVGPGTRSGGEDFAYTMQAIKRATVMGERTWGGAHPTGSYRLGDHFSARIPDRRSISPITNGNWEGVGVVPDIAVPSSDAIAAAKALLQRQLHGATTHGATNGRTSRQ